MDKGALRVLLIEDDISYAELVQMSLRRSCPSPIDIRHTRTLEEGLEAIRATVPDALLLDLTLPDAEGIDTLVRIYEEKSSVPVIVLTGVSDVEMGTEAVRAGAQDYILKDRADGDLLYRSIVYAIERRRAQLELTEAYQRLQRIDTLKDEVLSVVSHELRGATSIILSASDILGEELQLVEVRHKTLLEMITRNSKRMVRLLDDLLELSRIEAGLFTIHREEFDVGATVATLALEMETVFAREGLELTHNVPDGPLMIIGDEDRIAQAVTNLLRNAHRFADSSVSVRAYQKADAIQIIVEDDGPGIAEKDLELIFERFHRSRQPHHRDGFGLGLTIVKAIVGAHDGTIVATNRQVHSANQDGETGARFVMSFPASASHPH